MHPATAAADALARHEADAFRDFARAQAVARPLTRSERAEQRPPSAGRANLERFERAIAFLVTDGGFVPTYLQQKFLRVATIVLLPRMFGATIAGEMDYLRERYGLRQLYTTAAILFPRRSGKTVAQTLIAAAIAVSQPDGNVCTFNLTGRQSKAWLHQCIKWLEMFQRSPEFHYVELQRDLRETVMIRNCTGTTARISSYPGSTDGTGSNIRGMGERLAALLIDEHLFINANAYPTILPLLLTGAAMLLTSSMSANGDSEVTRMMYAKLPDGRDVMLRLDWIRACHTCTMHGLAAKCTHIMQRPSEFQRGVDIERVKALMKAFGEGNIDRELLNIGGRPLVEPAFARALIEPLRDRERDWTGLAGADYRTYFVALDPAGEGFSQNAILSAYIDTTAQPNGSPYTCVVIGAETCPVEDADALGECVLRHVLAVRRQVPGMRHATAVVLVESNLPLLAATVKRRLEAAGVQRLCVMSEDRKRARDHSDAVRAGTRTTRENKPEMIAAIQEMLVSRALCFHAHMVRPEAGGAAAAAAAVTGGEPRDQVVAELAAFKRIIKMPKGQAAAHGRPPSVVYSGKPGRDDYVMTLGFILLNYAVFMAAPAYRAYR